VLTHSFPSFLINESQRNEQRYIGLAEEYRAKTRADGETIEGLLKDYTK